MANAALDLLKGGGSKGSAETASHEEPPVEQEEETVEINIDDLKTHKDIDGLVAEFDLEVPEDWSKMTKDDKKKYLKENYEDDGDDGEEGSDEDQSEAAESGDADEAGGVAEGDEGDEEAPDSEESASAENGEAGDGDETAEEESAASALKKTMKTASEKPKPGKATPKTTKPKKTTKTVKKDVESESMTEDAYVKMVQDIEAMSKDKALKTAAILHEQSNITMFKLGGVLARIQENSWFEPYGTFQEYVENVHGMARRRALYWVSIYKHTLESNVPFSKLVHLPWSKLKEFVGIMTEDNADEWIELAETCTVNDLIEHVRAYKKKQASGDSGSDDETGVKKTFTKSFKLFEDQVETVDAAIAKIKEDSDIKDNNVALEHLALAYLGSPDKKIVNPLNFKGMDFESVITAVAEQFPDHDISVDAD